MPSTAPVKKAPAVKKATKPAAKKSTGSSLGLTAQQIAQNTVNASLAPILESLTGQRADLLDEQKIARKALSDFTDQIMRYIGAIPGQAAGSYNEAINATNNLAQTAATGLANLNPQAQNDALLSAIGAPDAQKAAIAAQNQQAFGGGGATLYQTSGAIPAAQIASDKANQLAFYQGLPAVAGLQGTQALKQLLFTQAKDRSALADKFAEVQAKRPGLVQESLSAMQDAELNRAKQDSLDQYRISLLENQRDKAKSDAEWRSKQAEIDQLNLDIRSRAAAANATGYDPVTGLPTPAMARVLKPDAPKPPKIITGKNGSIVSVDPITGKVTQLKPPGTLGTQSASSGKKKTTATPRINGMTVSQYASATQKAAAIVPSLFFGTVLNEKGKRIPANDAPGFKADDADTWGADKMSYNQALTKLKREYKLTAKDATGILDQLWERGDSGRPLFSYWERERLKKSGFTAAQITKAMRPEYRGTRIALRMYAVLGLNDLAAEYGNDPAAGGGFDFSMGGNGGLTG